MSESAPEIDHSLSAVPMAHPHRPSPWETTSSLLVIALGCLLSSIGIYYFFIPMKLAPGGISGLASLLNARFGINPSFTLLSSNLLLVSLSFRFIGREFVFKTLLGVALVSSFLEFHHLISSHYPFFNPKNMFSDRILACIFGGVINGFGIGLVLSRNGTTGGTEIGARMLSHLLPRYTIAQWLFAFDALIVLTGIVLFKSIEVGLYSTLALTISIYMVDLVLTGVNNSTGVYIISEASHIISERILLDMNRGATAFFGKGLYTGQEKDIIFCVIRSRELPILKNLIREEDPMAFVAVMPVKDVLGSGFNPLSSPKIPRPIIETIKKEVSSPQKWYQRLLKK